MDKVLQITVIAKCSHTQLSGHSLSTEDSSQDENSKDLKKKARKNGNLIPQTQKRKKNLKKILHLIETTSNAEDFKKSSS